MSGARGLAAGLIASLLVFLVGRPGQLLTREELCRDLWPDGVTVDFEHGLNMCVRQLRAALGGSAEAGGIIETIPRVGYRLRLRGNRTLDMFGEIFNVANRANFDNPITTVLTHPVADRRLTDFLQLRTLRPGAVPRTGQIGIRLGF